MESFIYELQASLQDGQVLLPGMEGYDASLKRWAASIELPATVVVYPLSSQDVSIAVQLAVKHSVPFTTVCGGHGTSGDSSISKGMLINMRRMNSIEVDTTNLTLTCDGGCIWEEIDAASSIHNISCVAGTVQATGVAGYTTGGGFGWLSGQHGLAIDNLLSAEIVLADGRIVCCSQNQEPDLYWAIRGAGHHFGVVTKFVFQGFSQPNLVYGGMVMFPPTPAAIEHLITFANNMLAQSDGRTAMMCGFATPPHLQKRVIFGCCFHDGPETEAIPIFEPLLTNTLIKPLKSTLAPITMAQMNNILGMSGAMPGRRVSKGSVFSPPLAPSTFANVLSLYEEFIQEIPEAGQSGAALFEFYPLDKIASVPTTATAFAGRTRHSNVMITPRWLSAENDEKCRDFARRAMGVVSSAGQWGEGEGRVDGEMERREYTNYDGLGTPAKKVYGENYERLCVLKKMYDPMNVFGKRFGLLESAVGEEQARLGDREEEVESIGSDTASSASSPGTPDIKDGDEAVDREKSGIIVDVVALHADEI